MMFIITSKMFKQFEVLLKRTRCGILLTAIHVMFCFVMFECAVTLTLSFWVCFQHKHICYGGSYSSRTNCWLLTNNQWSIRPWHCP